MADYTKLAVNSFRAEVVEHMQEDERRDKMRERMMERRRGEVELPTSPVQRRRVLREGQDAQHLMPLGFTEMEVREDLWRRLESDMSWQHTRGVEGGQLA